MHEYVVKMALSKDQGKRLEQQARERGYSSVEDYLLALAEADSESLGDRFERALRDALRGNVLSEAEFWEAVNADDE